MQKLIISIVLCLGLLTALSANAVDNSMLRSDVPSRYEVVKGDTLWDIAARFLKEPWRWSEIWGLNRDQLKNPHKIYPGDTIILQKTLQGNRLQLIQGKADHRTVKLSPQIRIDQARSKAIPSIPAAVIEPFLSQPLVVEKDGLALAPYLLGTSDNRVVLSTGNTVYVANMPDNLGKAWQIFRSGKALKDPDQNNRVIGFEAEYLGNASVKVFDEISTAVITHSTQEILKGDRLVPAPGLIFNNYAPHAPETLINGRIISVYGGVTEISRGSIVTLNKGMLDGMEMGHVLAVYRRSQTRLPDGKMVELPEERTGLVFVFRVFDQLSYALVVRSTGTIKILDAVKNP
ncbi:MAG: LysM peptidoglycan-binding domain-containing protein [Burkholderiales bacterium]|uniref:LysM peptidoglycan-binding domain-containing protein n=1 Tax=Nitrosomonas sp. TaxID=42353 RepID=UPI001D4DC4C0|nr:LysM peptidoglycan-binding domain-containing protein [Nitrosomonas sp.]MCB1947762.1 LysM peptidoglycan-binding domain-containing protein [Nitrosomonas sp.]MCP5243608.1 LysM peptidoglycan-binding domain-containing protein [Burkholderiales bacterium]